MLFCSENVKRDLCITLIVSSIIVGVFCFYLFQERDADQREYLFNVIERPIARLYPLIQFRGEFLTFNPSRHLSPSCMNFGALANSTWRLRSLDPHLTCVRLFHELHCEGQSIAFYPKIGVPQHGIRNIRKNYKSIGKCYGDELRESKVEWIYYEDGSGKEAAFSKHHGNDDTPFIPDIIHFGIPNSLGMKERGNWPSREIGYYSTGHHGRLEFVCAFLYPPYGEYHHKLGNQSSVSFLDLQKYVGEEEGYTPGQFIASRLKPPKFLEYNNIFLQRPSNQKKQIDVEQTIFEWLWRWDNEQKFVTVQINIDYKYEWTMRPTGFNYQVDFFGERKMASYMSNQLQ